MRRTRGLLLALFVISIPCQSITIVKNVGHGDCYAVISDGRIIVVDAGTATSTEGLVSFLRQEYFHYDRIVITHVHSDHAGGLLTASQYAKREGSALSADMLVSNHGQHDIDLVVHESRLRPLMDALRDKPIVGLDDPALEKLAFADENIAVEGIVLDKSRRTRNENRSSLVLKVTEIRDGERRAVLFLGDIEKAQQAELFSRADAREVFRDVHAITIPHHGRKTTLARGFFEKARALAGPDLVLLHSDRSPLDRRLGDQAKDAGLTVKSTADTPGQDIYVDLFGKGKTYHVVREPMVSLSDIVASEESRLITGHGFRVDEVAEAVSRFSNRTAARPLPTDSVMSWPTGDWIVKEVERSRAELGREVDSLIARLQSKDLNESAEAERQLTERLPKMNSDQASRFDTTLQAVRARRAEERFYEETERLLVQLESRHMPDSLAAERELEVRRGRLSQSQSERFDEILQDFRQESERLILQLQSLDMEEATRAEEALASRRERLKEGQVKLVDRLSKDLATRRQLASEIAQVVQGGWRAERNPNIDENKIFLYRRSSLRYVVREIDYETWEIHRPGARDGLGLAAYGKAVGRVPRPADVDVVEREICEYCGKEAYGYCTKRHKYVCETHRYFTLDGVSWKCP